MMLSTSSSSRFSERAPVAPRRSARRHSLFHLENGPGGQNFTVIPEYSEDSVQVWLLTPGATLQTALSL